jgi:hypothetical protein
LLSRYCSCGSTTARTECCLLLLLLLLLMSDAVAVSEATANK